MNPWTPPWVWYYVGDIPGTNKFKIDKWQGKFDHQILILYEIHSKFDFSPTFWIDFVILFTKSASRGLLSWTWANVFDLVGGTSLADFGESGVVEPRRMLSLPDFGLIGVVEPRRNGISLPLLSKLIMPAEVLPEFCLDDEPRRINLGDANFAILNEHLKILMRFSRFWRQIFKNRAPKAASRFWKRALKTPNPKP